MKQCNFSFYNPSLTPLMYEIPEMVNIRTFNNTIYVQIFEEYYLLGMIQVPVINYKVKSWKVDGDNIDINVQWENE